MVAIKIQSFEDILGAFLENLGFGDNEKQKTLAFLVDEYNKKGKPDLAFFIDDIIHRKVKYIFENVDWDISQKTALFKYIFLSKKLASKYGYDFFAKEQPDEKFVALMRENVLNPVPPCCYSEMPRQVIASPHPGKFLNKVLHMKRD